MNRDLKLKEIVHDLLRQCFRHNIILDEDFLKFYVNLVLMDPRIDINDQSDIKSQIFEQLKHHNRPEITTIKLQWYFKNNFESKSKINQTNRNLLSNKLSNLENRILNARNVTEPIYLKQFFNDIVNYITLLSGLGNPTYESVIQEATAALKSIISENELKDLTTLPKSQKLEHILFCMRIVGGIRIFNKDCNKGGEDIVDLPRIIYKSIDIIREGLRKLLVSLMQKINILTTAIDKSYVLSFKEDGVRCMQSNFPDTVSAADIDYIKSLLITYRQYEVFLREIMTIIEDDETINKLFDDLKSTLTKIHDVCSIRIAVPCATIFPHFEKLAEIWTQLQDEAVYLSHIDNIIKNLNYYVSHLTYSNEKVNIMLGDSEVMTDAQRLKKYPGVELSTLNDDVYTIPPNDNMDSLYIECFRCDPWKLVQTNGGLLPGVPNLGVAVTNNKYHFVFSEPESANAFFADVPGTILQLCELFTKKLELIEMFNAEKYMEIIKNHKFLQQKSLEKTFSAETQTEHFLREDPNYSWNVWELKRNALRLTDVHKRRTKQAQTLLKNSENTAGVQTNMLLDKVTQSNKDQCTNTKN